MPALMLVLMLILVLLALTFWAYERRVWNGGLCRKTGTPWVLFDRDSQGGRGYQSGNEITWISWPFVDHRRSKACIARLAVQEYHDMGLETLIPLDSYVERRLREHDA